MDNEFIGKGKMKISYQVGMDGVKHSFTLPRYALILLIVFLAFLLISTILMFTIANSNAQRNASLKRLETENKELRAKLDFYAATVDSIYKRLDNLQIKVNEGAENYPVLNFKQGEKKVYVFEPALRNRMEDLETKMAAILVLISEPENTVPVLPAGENVADYIPSIYPAFGRISDGWAYEFILFVMKLSSTMVWISLMNRELLFMLLPPEQLQLRIMKPVMVKE